MWRTDLKGLGTMVRGLFLAGLSLRPPGAMLAVSMWDEIRPETNQLSQLDARDNLSYVQIWSLSNQRPIFGYSAIVSIKEESVGYNNLAINGDPTPAA